MPRYLVLSFSFILLVLFFLNLGNFLDISQEPRKAELIVCLGGGEKHVRIKKAISIYQILLLQNKLPLGLITQESYTQIQIGA